jgi:S-formylglutathione hydrolase
MRPGSLRRPAFNFQLAVLLVLLSATAGIVFSQAGAASKHGTLQRITVHGKSLEGNLEGDSPDRDVSVYLPPSYSTDPHRRYPVLYLLHGFTDKDTNWFGNPKHFVNAPEAIDKAFSSGTAEMIVVMPNAYTLYQGSMYSNSATVGDWEDFIANDLVAYIDNHYRTMADRLSRGLAGHSMGGYGTLRLAMKRPDVFSSIYAMSACCLAASLTPPSPEAVKKMEAIHVPADLAKADFVTRVVFASAAAWSPDPKNPPLFLDLPEKNGEFQPGVAAKWAANAPLSLADQYIENIRRLHAIAFDIGSKDFLFGSGTAQALDRILTAYEIPHTFETYEGDHVNRVGMRLQTRVLPFFGQNLSFKPPRR